MGDMAQSLQRVPDYGEPDIGEVFGDLDWAATGRLAPEAHLTLDTKADFVQAYIDWFFAERIQAQFVPLSEGFRAILGGSALLQGMRRSTMYRRSGTSSRALAS